MNVNVNSNRRAHQPQAVDRRVRDIDVARVARLHAVVPASVQLRVRERIAKGMQRVD